MRYRVYGYRTAEDNVYLDVEADSPSLAISAAKAEVEEVEDNVISNSIVFSDIDWSEAVSMEVDA